MCDLLDFGARTCKLNDYWKHLISGKSIEGFFSILCHLLFNDFSPGLAKSDQNVLSPLLLTSICCQACHDENRQLEENSLDVVPISYI